MNMSRNFFGVAIVVEVEVGSTFHNGPRNAAMIFPALRRGVTLGNVA